MKIVKVKDRYVKSYSVTNQKVVLTSEIKKLMYSESPSLLILYLLKDWLKQSAAKL